MTELGDLPGTGCVHARKVGVQTVHVKKTHALTGDMFQASSDGAKELTSVAREGWMRGDLHKVRSKVDQCRDDRRPRAIFEVESASSAKSLTNILSLRSVSDVEGLAPATLAHRTWNWIKIQGGM